MIDGKKYRKFDGFTTNAWRRPEASPEPEPGDYVTTEELEQGLATKQNLLTAGSNITIENDVISANGSGGVFVCTYGETTGEEIEAAYQSGKVCVVQYEDKTAILSERRREGTTSLHAFQEAAR